MGDRRLAVNEFGAAFRSVSELGSRKWENAAAAPVTRLDNADAPTRPRKLARRHQARGTRADNDDMLGNGHANALSARSRRRVLDPVPQQHRAAVQHAAAF